MFGTRARPGYFAALVLLGAGCGGEGDKTKPVLQNLGVAIEPWDGVVGSDAGAFSFQNANPDAPFTAFGDVIANKTWVNIEFKPKLDAQILSPMDGVVTRIFAQEDPDEGFEIHLRSKKDSLYLVSLDHVRNPTVEKGDKVTAGQVLGIPGTWGAVAGQFELQINDDVHDEYDCPTQFLDVAVASSMSAAVLQLVEDWETFKADPTIFDEGAMVLAGCLEESLDP